MCKIMISLDVFFFYFFNFEGGKGGKRAKNEGAKRAEGQKIAQN